MIFAINRANEFMIIGSVQSMKPEDIIYWNQFSGLTESFSKTDMRLVKTINVYGFSKHTDLLVQQLLNDGEISFEKRVQFIPRNIFAPKMHEGKLKCKLTLRLKEKTDTYIDTCLSEYTDTTDTECVVGWIKFVNKINNPINCVKGKCATIIHDVSLLTGSVEANSALGILATAFGAYLLGKMDGDWQRIGKSYRDVIYSPIDENKALKAEIEKLKNDFFIEKTQFETKISNYKNTINNLNRKLKETSCLAEKQRAKISELEAKIKTYNHKQKISTIKKEKRDYTKELLLSLSGKKVCFVGGALSWRQKIEECIPASVFISDVNFDENLIRNSDIVIINTNFIGHDVTNKATNIAGSARIKIIYTSKNNLDSMSKDILKSIKL